MVDSHSSSFRLGPLFLMDWELGMAWGMSVALPCTIAAALSVLAQAFRLLMYFLNRPKPLSK
jgi:hypothetical protein